MLTSFRLGNVDHMPNFLQNSWGTPDMYSFVGDMRYPNSEVPFSSGHAFSAKGAYYSMETSISLLGMFLWWILSFLQLPDILSLCNKCYH